LANFARYVLPLVIERGLTVFQAHNPRKWELSENQGVTREEMNDWIRAGHAEVWSLTSSERGQSTPENVQDESVVSPAESEEQLPAAEGNVWGYSKTGSPGESYVGHRQGSTAAEWTSPPGFAILANHAVASGNVPG